MDEWKVAVKKLFPKVRTNIQKKNDAEVRKTCESILELVPNSALEYDHPFIIRISLIKNSARMHALENDPKRYVAQLLTLITDAESEFEKV